MSNNPILEAEKINVTFGKERSVFHALCGVDIALHAGELLLLMGPSGSGKSTLLSVLGCLLRPSAGQFSIAGHSTIGMENEQLASLRRAYIGFIFQSYNLFPALSAFENVRLGLTVRGTKRSRNDQLEIRALGSVGLLDKLNNRPGTLSGGQQQRVAIARATAGDPPVILADEPTSALDSVAGHEIMQLLSDLAHKSGRAVLVVSHDARIRSFADRTIYLEDGRVVSDLQTGDPRPDEHKEMESFCV